MSSCRRRHERGAVAVQSEEEYLVPFKTRRTRAEWFKRELAEVPTYEAPEILLFEVRDAAYGHNQRRRADDEDDPHGSKA